MKIKITISIEEVHNQVELYFKKHYSDWVDFASYHRNNAKVQIDITKLISDTEVKVQCLKHKELLSLMYSKRGNHAQLYFFVLRKIRKAIQSVSR